MLLLNVKGGKKTFECERSLNGKVRTTFYSSTTSCSCIYSILCKGMIGLKLIIVFKKVAGLLIHYSARLHGLMDLCEELTGRVKERTDRSINYPIKMNTRNFQGLEG